MKILRRHLTLSDQLKLSRPVVETGMTDVPVSLGAEEIAELDNRIPYTGAVPMSHRFESGHRCYALLDGTEITSFVWVVSDGAVYVAELAAEVNVPPGVAYFYDAFTFQEQRGRGLMGRLLRDAAARVSGTSPDVRRCESWIARRNRPSIRAFEKAGFEVYGAWRAFRLGPFRLTTGDPWIGAAEPPRG